MLALKFICLLMVFAISQVQGIENDDSIVEVIPNSEIQGDDNSSEEKVSEVQQTLGKGLGDLAAAVVEKALFNPNPSPKYDFQECLGAMSNIIEEEHLFEKVKNATRDALQILSNATSMILKCRERQSFSSCTINAVNTIGPAFIAITEDLEQILITALIVGEKLVRQVKQCIGRDDVSFSDVVYSLLHFVHFEDNTRLKNDDIKPTEDVNKNMQVVPWHPNHWYSRLRPIIRKLL